MDLPEIAVDDFDAAVLSELAGFESEAPPPSPTLNANLELPADRKLARTPTARKLIDAQQVESIRRTIGTLPRRGETYHIVICGKSSLWDVVPATLTLAAPATIRTLYVATPGFSARNTTELLELLDTKRIRRVRFLCSHYFKGTSESLYTPMHDGLVARGQKFLAMRTHAKILLIELSDGRRIVAEGSANLRSCKNIEQITLTHDAALYKFHAAWMDSLFAQVLG
jgi:hypothetical protein